MMKRILVVMCLLVFTLGAPVSFAENARTFIESVLQKIEPRLSVKSVDDSPVSGIAEVVLSNDDILYVDPSSRVFFIGQMIAVDDASDIVNITKQKQDELSVAQNSVRKTKIAKIESGHKVTYSPKGEVKARIHVFTDVSCPYCVKLHREVEDLNAMGVEVSYLAFPRSGQGSRAHKQMNAIWCAGDHEMMRQAMNQAKLKGGIKGSDCDTPVIEQMVLGQGIGVTGTPAIIFEDGTLLPGYLPAAHLAKRLGLK